MDVLSILRLEAFLKVSQFWIVQFPSLVVRFGSLEVLLHR
jgi:hypothetical protein